MTEQDWTTEQTELAKLSWKLCNRNIMYQIHNKPESELPWTEYVEDGTGYDWTDRQGIHVNMFNDDNQAYILHSANAYPKLIELIKKWMGPESSLDRYYESEKLLKELGEWNQ